MFIDEKKLTVKAGKGGDGATLFRREIYVPRGGPDGGDGGKGGNVIFRAKHDLHALNHLAHTDTIRADDGKTGGHSRSSGKSGEDVFCDVPLGTIISLEQPDGSLRQLAELTRDEEEFIIAKGGNGGWGNWHFKSSVQQTPDRHNAGLPGEEKNVVLTLTLIADIGLVGLPNAGKSTLLASVSAARPKIANYPFTTLEPQLGVAEIGTRKEQRSVVIADLPGLIEGASQGKGLGIKFLRHLERTKAIIHCIDITTPVEEIGSVYTLIRNELIQWSPELAKKPERIALTKAKLLPPEEIILRQKALQKVTTAPIFVISAIAHQGLTELLSESLTP